MIRTLELPWPPSTNGYWRSFRGRQIVSKKGRDYKKRVGSEVLIDQPFVEELAVKLILFPPDRKRRDCDNYLKATLDAMTHVGLWVDDSQIKDIRILMKQPSKPGHIILIVMPLSVADPTIGVA